MHSSKAQVGWPWACVSCHPPKGFHQSSETGLKWSQKYAAVESSALSSVLVGLHPGILEIFAASLVFSQVAKGMMEDNWPQIGEHPRCSPKLTQSIHPSLGAGLTGCLGPTQQRIHQLLQLGPPDGQRPSSKPIGHEMPGTCTGPVLVIWMFKCLGPVWSAVMKGKFTSVLDQGSHHIL